MRPMLQMNARNVRKLDRFISLLFSVLFQNRNRPKIQAILRRGRILIGSRFKSDARVAERRPPQSTSAPRDFRRYDAKVLNKILSPPINPTPSEKLFRTKPLPCFNISPRTACAARYKNPPPTCAMNKASQNEDVFAKKRKPIIPPSSVVASTAATQPSARSLGHPAPIKRLPNARPSGIL